MNKALLTVPDFCGQFSISRTVAYHEMKEGRLRATKVGRRTYIAAVDAQAWLDLVRKVA
jgi:hypothetical protein